MAATKPQFTTIDQYIDTFDAPVQEQLQSLRKALEEAVPEAEEAIKYGMPTLTLDGNLVHFAAYKMHISVFALPSTVLSEFEAEVSTYRTEKGALQFPLDGPLPLPLLRRLVKRAAELRSQRKLETPGR